MIILILGQKGSGKTIRVIREMVIKGKNRTVYTNFNTSKVLGKHTKVIRLKYSDIVKKTVKETKKDGTPKSWNFEPNFELH